MTGRPLNDDLEKDSEGEGEDDEIRAIADWEALLGYSSTVSKGMLLKL